MLEEAEKFDTKNPKIAELKNKFTNEDSIKHVIIQMLDILIHGMKSID